jgi:hypothetical protein
MFQFKIGTLIYDIDDQEWGLISGYVEHEDGSCFSTIWSKSKDQDLSYSDLEQDRFEIFCE